MTPSLLPVSVLLDGAAVQDVVAAPKPQPVPIHHRAAVDGMRLGGLVLDPRDPEAKRLCGVSDSALQQRNSTRPA